MLVKPLPLYDKRKYRFDYLAARQTGHIPWHVSKDDRMEASEAGLMMERLQRLYRIDRENPSVLMTFTDALFFFHTVNSGSVLQPGRSKIYIQGQEFDAYMAISYLGVDVRRFFRAFADDVRRVNKKVLEDYDPYDPEAVERRNWLIQVASDRGLMRYPDLAHDSSDKCDLTPSERMAVANSKVSVFHTIINAADRFNSNSRTTTSDDYDSTNLTTVHNKSTVEK